MRIVPKLKNQEISGIISTRIQRFRCSGYAPDGLIDRHALYFVDIVRTPEENTIIMPRNHDVRVEKIGPGKPGNLLPGP